MNEDLLKPKNNPFADTRPVEMDAKIKELDLWGAEFDQYMSPFALAIAHGIDEATMNAVVNVGVTVDKEELLKALQYDRDQFAAGFKAGKKSAQPKWISVEERLPGEFVDVLLYGDSRGIAIGSYDANDGYFWKREDENTLHSVNATHWMPLPNGPKEEA